MFVRGVCLGVWGVVLVVCVYVGVGGGVLCRCVCMRPIDLFTLTCSQQRLRYSRRKSTSRQPLPDLQRATALSTLTRGHCDARMGS